MEIAIIHPSLSFLGGEELASVLIAKWLREEMKAKITYYTLDKTEWSLVKNILGVDFRPDREWYMFSKLPERLPFPCLLYMMSSKLKGIHYGEDLIIVTQVDIYPFLRVGTRVYLLYIQHTPPWCWHSPMNVYYKIPYILALHRSLHKRPLPYLIVVNSKYLEHDLRYRRCMDAFMKSYILYPPCPVREFMKHSRYNKENWVVSIGRFTPKKRFEELLRIAKNVTEATFFIIGRVYRLYDRFYFKRISNLREKMRLKNVILIPNATFSLKKDIMSRSKIYLHTTVGEHFGISIIEGMACGCIPIVHRSGGPWIDIMGRKQGYYGFAYTKKEEAIKFIKAILNDEISSEELAIRARMRATNFTIDAFLSRLRIIFETLQQIVEL